MLVLGRGLRPPAVFDGSQNSRPSDGARGPRCRAPNGTSRSRQWPSTVSTVASLSPRLKAIVDALPLRAGLRVIEIGCGPGAAAHEVAEHVGASGHVLAVDRSAKAIDLLTESAPALISARKADATPRERRGT